MRNLFITSFFLLWSLSGACVWGATPPEQEALARRLLNSQGCKACHKFEGHGTSTGAGLEELSRNLDQAALYQALANPERQHGNGIIPDFSHLSANDLEALVSFLHDLPSADQKNSPNPDPDKGGQAPPSDTTKP